MCFLILYLPHLSSLSPWWPVCSVWDCFCFIILIHLFLWIPHIGDSVLFLLWYISLGVIPSRSICVVADAEFHSFLWLSDIPLCMWECVCMCVCLYTTSSLFHSPVDACLGCFHVFAVVDNAAVVIGVHVSFWISTFFFFRYMPRIGTTGHMVAYFQFFEEPSCSFPWGCTNLPSH